MTEPKTHARPGSRWNSSNRHPQKAYEQPKGFARGCRVTPKRHDSELPAAAAKSQ